MKIRMALVAVLLAFCLPAVADDAKPAKLPKRQFLHGIVEDAGKGRVGNAMVFLLDAKTGLPYSQFSSEPWNEPSINDDLLIVNEVTTKFGEFYVKGVFPGTYRAVAQSWDDADLSNKNLTQIHGKRMTVRGTSAPVEVTEDKEPAKAIVRPIGTASIDLSIDGASIVVISTHPPSGDIILGGLALVGPFVEHVVGATYVGEPITIDGLPEGDLYIFAAGIDRRGPMGETHVKVKAGEKVTAKIELRDFFEGPSPVPERIYGILKILGENKLSASVLVQNALGDKGRDFKRPSDAMPYLDVPVTLPGGQSVAVRDLFAAEEYARLNRGKKVEMLRTDKTEPPDEAKDTSPRK